MEKLEKIHIFLLFFFNLNTLLINSELISALISTPIPVLFQEHWDCLVIYRLKLLIRTVNHNGPCSKEEPVGLALTRRTRALLRPSHPLYSRPPCSLVVC